MALWTMWMFFAAAAGVLLTLAALIAILRTLHHTKRAADAAADMVHEAKLTTKAANDTIEETRRIGVAQTRAYLQFSLLEVEYIPVGGGSKDGIRISGELSNKGYSPALDGKSGIWIGFERPDFDQTITSKIKFNPTNAYIAPSTTLSSVTMTVPFKGFVEDADNDRPLWFLIVFSYLDVFGDPCYSFQRGQYFVGREPLSASGLVRHCGQSTVQFNYS